MTDLTDRLDAIQKRKDAATEGPWRTWKDDGGRRGSAVETAWAYDADGADTELITDWCSTADAEFIANAPTDIRFLLDLARKQQAALAEVEEWLKTLDDIEEGDPTTPTHLNVSAGGLARAIRAAMKSTLEAKP
jgi:hypothetical protein